eukprot:3783033-Ditylum_brightwellii.AAC.1
MGNTISDTFGGQRGSNSEPLQWAWSAPLPRMEEDVVIPLLSLSPRIEEDVVIPLSSLKLASQKIVEFSRRIEDWQKWKNRTSCAL